VGGDTGKVITPSVEILNQGAKAFVLGKALPLGISYCNLLEDPSGGVIILNGLTNTG